MCGFAGFLSVVAQSKDDLCRVAQSMADAIKHRGPDDQGVWADPESGVALGHVRLSVVDLSAAGHQPMVSVCGRYVLIFNGEIYNHTELRRQLQSDPGAPAWRGHSDTETLLACISAWGLSRTLPQAIGMFGLALWDRRDRTLHLARDRMGEKPVFYGWVKGGFAFGSELKALRAHPGFQDEVDRGSLALYMQYRSVPAPLSIYKGVHKLPPGCILTLPIYRVNDQTARIEPYWSFLDTAQQGLSDPFATEDEALRVLETTLSEAVAGQSIADVPLGAFLSGGIDSSLIVALMQAQSARPVQTFTVGFDEAGFDESAAGGAVARHLRTKHHELRVRPQDALSVIPLLPHLYDEPFADSSQIPTYLMCKAARGYVTVALSGDAGDELFGGYNRYTWGPALWKRVSAFSLPLRNSAGAALTAVPPTAWDGVARLLGQNRRFTQIGEKAHKVGRALKSGGDIHGFYKSLISEWPEDHRTVMRSTKPATPLDSMQDVASVTRPEDLMMIWDSLTYLPDDILTKVDRAAMGVSLETRVPFLDPRVIQAAWRLPLTMKIRHGQGKWALRQLLYKHVPRELIERPKAGFAIPVGDWLRGPLRDWAEDLLDARRLDQEGFLDPAPIRRAWSQHLSGRHDWGSRLWTVLMFQAWLKTY